MLKGESLALVHSDGPCQPEGVLLEVSLHLLFYLLALLVYGIFGVFPGLRGHVYVVLVFMAPHHDGVHVLFIVPDNVSHCAYLAVVVLLGSAGVVFDEHDLRPSLQHQLLVCRITVFWKVAAHLCHECHGWSGYLA